MSLPGSEYIRWAKSRERFAYNLGRSSIRCCPDELLGATADDFRLAGPNAHGWAPLTTALAGRYGVESERLVLAVGCSMANHLAMAALLSPGDHVLVESPGYAPLRELPALLGARVESFPRAEPDWGLDVDAIGRRVRPETRLVVLTDPHNPTGRKAADDSLAALAGLAERHGFHVLVDEVYREFTYRPGESIAARLGPLWLSTCSLTKAYGLDGLRMGWTIASASLSARIRALNDLYGIIMPHPSERLAFRALQRLDVLREEVDRLLAHNRPLVEDLVARRPELSWSAPDHGPVGFVRLAGAAVGAVVDALEADHDTTLTPGRFFERPDHFRIGFGMPTEDLEAALPYLDHTLDRLRSKAPGEP